MSGLTRLLPSLAAAGCGAALMFMACVAFDRFIDDPAVAEAARSAVISEYRAAAAAAQHQARQERRAIEADFQARILELNAEKQELEANVEQIIEDFLATGSGGDDSGIDGRFVR